LIRIFSSLYDRVMVWSRHRHAPWYLAGLSFSESSFFPIPPDVMLAPMSMAKPRAAFDLITPLVTEGGRYAKPFAAAEAWFEKWGVWAVLIAGFSPIPYKVFTISAGVLHMALIPFLIASAVGRGGRFFLVSALMAWGGERMESGLRTYVDRVGWIMVLLVVLVVILR